MARTGWSGDFEGTSFDTFTGVFHKNGTGEGKLIVYSLGDFVFDKRAEFLRDRTGPRFFLKVVLKDKKRVSWQLLVLLASPVHDAASFARMLSNIGPAVRVSS